MSSAMVDVYAVVLCDGGRVAHDNALGVRCTLVTEGEQFAIKDLEMWNSGSLAECCFIIAGSAVFGLTIRRAGTHVAPLLVGRHIEEWLRLYGRSQYWSILSRMADCAMRAHDEEERNNPSGEEGIDLSEPPPAPIVSER